MPIYEYQCKKCGETTEVLQKFSDAPLSVCPGCGGSVSKMMSMNSFQLKGSGWYVTDYAGKKESSSTPAPAKDAPASSDASPAASAPKETPAASGAVKESAPAKA